ncbi:recombinase RecT [Ruminococcus sp.]|uniref:recombinase RecT n=1 Tax=Ruminococcus sp. TaxID=41978 RepID=UPI001B680DF2|nr:recombinase RecT [Ruminococcus sp.]MBP5430805.1 recombinase RecT [Ruminococcus sp.]
MAVKNQIAKQEQKPKFSAVISSDGYKRLINNTLGTPQRAARFVTAITSAVSTNPALSECEPATIVSAGLLGEGLNLSPSPQLGQYYLVPFNDRKNGRKVAQFQLGYKGYIQLAIRSGQYKKLNVLPIKEGELVSFNPLDEDIEVNLIENEAERENAPTIGYYAMFEYTNGFKKAIYWSKAKMESHAEKYSMGYKARKGYTFWEKDFDAMACKTMLRQLISKWGIMSIEMQKALENDMGVINTNGSVDYVDTPTEDEPTVEATAAVVEEPVEVSVEEIPPEQAPADEFADLMNG